MSTFHGTIYRHWGDFRVLYMVVTALFEALIHSSWRLGLAYRRLTHPTAVTLGSLISAPNEARPALTPYHSAVDLSVRHWQSTSIHPVPALGALLLRR